MEATELRIGNIISFYNMVEPKKEVAVDGRFLASFSKYDKQVSNYYKPILLTEEWLLKFGFKVHSKYSFWNYILPNGWFISMYMDDKQSAGFEEKGVCYWSDNYVAIKYVHQLQNLYWCLVGKELEILTD